MSKNFKMNTLKPALEPKSGSKVPSRKAANHEHAAQNVLKSLTTSVNQNCPEFVLLNKKETIKRLDRRMLEKIKEFETQGFSCFECFSFDYYKVYMI